MIRGQHHRVAAKYLGGYAAHAGWLEDHRLESNGGLTDRLIRNALSIPVSAPGRGTGKAQAKTFDSGPDADPLALLDHGHDFPPSRVSQGLSSDELPWGAHPER